MKIREKNAQFMVGNLKLPLLQKISKYRYLNPSLTVGVSFALTVVTKTRYAVFSLENSNKPYLEAKERLDDLHS